MIKERKLRIGWMVILLFPCLCILPGAVEIRFFIALHFVIYMLGVVGIKDFISEVKRHKAIYSALYFGGFILYISWCGYLLSSINEGITIINSGF